MSGVPTFAARLRELRVERGLRQRELAAALGLAQTTIANYEQGTRFPDESTLRKTATYFRVGFDELLGPAAAQESAPAVEPSASDAPGEIARRYLERLRARDEPGALDLVKEALAASGDPRRVYLEVLEPALHEVGRLWETGEMDVAEEHRITNVADRHMAETRAAGRRGTRPNGRRLACLTVPGDEHRLGARMVSDFLEMDGWSPVYLGGNLSIRHTVEALEKDPPELLLLSATVPQVRHAMEDMISAVRARPALRSLGILVGGQLVNRDPELWRRAGADGTATGAEEAVEAARRLAASGPVGTAPR